jgi:predicted GH43/DUF377 family glycosyl hydrolase
MFVNGSVQAQSDWKPWMLGPFNKPEASEHVILGPNFNSQFFDPILKKKVRWEARAIIGGATVVRNGQVQMIYQAEDLYNGFNVRNVGSPGIMRMGLAKSKDGQHFTSNDQPVLYPANDDQKYREWPGGCEIPRLIESADGTYYLYYNAWDKDSARMQVATSKDLVTWTKHGSPFQKYKNGKYAKIWSKSGSVVTKLINGKLVAVKINGKYWMYWGEGIFAATSDDLINWEMVESDDRLLQIAKAREGFFDDGYLEGGLAVLTDNGIVVIYNSFRNSAPNRWSGMGELLIEKSDPTKVIDRCTSPILKPDREYELQGSVDDVVFATGLVFFHNRWILYHNGGDRVMCAVASDEPQSKDVKDRK